MNDWDLNLLSRHHSTVSDDIIIGALIEKVNRQQKSIDALQKTID